MALRNVRIEGDPVLYKVCKPIREVTPRIDTLIDDMFETMYDQDGVGLAAPQVGVLRRLCVIDVGVENEEGIVEQGIQPYVFINPELLETEGEQTGAEGCLSIPGKVGQVTRPMRVKVKAYDREMKEFTLEATELLARAICHEMDHLDGHLYDELAEGPLEDVDYEGEDEAE